MKYRRSNYCIFVDLDGTDKKTMMLHAYTGAMDIVQAQIATFLKEHSMFEEEEINFSKDSLALLIARGYITTKSAAEEKDYVRRFAELLHKIPCAISKDSFLWFPMIVIFDVLIAMKQVFLVTGINGAKRLLRKKWLTGPMMP